MAKEVPRRAADGQEGTPRPHLSSARSSSCRHDPTRLHMCPPGLTHDTPGTGHWNRRCETLLKDITAVGVTGATCVQSYLLSESWPSSVPHCGLWISKCSAICKSVLRKWENRKTEKQGRGVAPGRLLLGVHHRVTANAVVTVCTHHHEPRHMTPPTRTS